MIKDVIIRNRGANVNLEKLKGNIGWRMQLAPQAIHLDEFGRELPGKNEDWIIRTVTADEVRLDEAIIMGYTVALGADYVQSFASNPSRSVPGGLQYGFLKLTMQMYIPRDKPIWFQPCMRPGERLPPPAVQIGELSVDLHFPEKAGIQTRLLSAGYQIGWARLSQLPSRELDGWEIVIEKDNHGRPSRFMVRDPRDTLVYVKRRRM